MAKFAINASGAMLLPSLVQVSESISGSVVPLAMFFLTPSLGVCGVSTGVQLTVTQRMTFVTFWSFVNYFKLTEDKKTVHNIRVSNIF